MDCRSSLSIPGEPSRSIARAVVVEQNGHTETLEARLVVGAKPKMPSPACCSRVQASPRMSRGSGFASMRGSTDGPSGRNVSSSSVISSGMRPLLVTIVLLLIMALAVLEVGAIRVKPATAPIAEAKSSFPLH